jgi:hypothetical protein
MSTIYTRAGKGSALTWAEGDANITNLNNDKLQNVVEDTTPQLGGSLDVNGNSIVSVSNGNITIAPNGTGRILLAGQTWPSMSGSAGITGTITIVNTTRTPNVITLSGTNNFSTNTAITFSGAQVTSIGLTSGQTYYIAANTGSEAYEISNSYSGGPITLNNPGSINDLQYAAGAIAAPSSGNILTYGTSGVLSWASASATLDSLSDVTTSGATNGQILSYNGSNWQASNLSFPTSPISSAVSIYTGNGHNLNIGTSSGIDGDLYLNGKLFPKDNGTDGYVLKTNGSGTLSWVAQTAAFDPASPGAIGGTTKAAGTFTTMTADVAVLDDIRETVAALTYGATITPNAADGSIRSITLTGNVTFSAFTSPVSGQTITLIITQDATGSRTLTSTMKFAGASKTLSTAANAIDILTVSYIGTTYYASLVKGFA